jgi:hypothetical protein
MELNYAILMDKINCSMLNRRHLGLPVLEQDSLKNAIVYALLALWLETSSRNITKYLPIDDGLKTQKADPFLDRLFHFTLPNQPSSYISPFDSVALLPRSG